MAKSAFRDWLCVANAVDRLAIKAHLKDPDSAKISVLPGPKKAVVYVESGVPGRSAQAPGYQVYARVDAKNSFGGYTGDKLWAVSMVQGRPVYCLELF